MLPVGTAEEVEAALLFDDDAPLPVGTAEEAEAVALLDYDAPLLSASASAEEAEMTIVLLNDDDPVWRVKELGVPEVLTGAFGSIVFVACCLVDAGTTELLLAARIAAISQ